jgi:hypothetical protein
MKSEAVVPTNDPQGALRRLCAHFRDDHDFDVDALADRAKITFAEGGCALRAEADGVTVWLKVWDEELRASTEAFIARHLQRLVLRARQPVAWTRICGDGVSEDDAPTLKLRMLASVLDRAAALEQRT